MQTIDLDLEEANEVSFKLRVEGSSSGQVIARLCCETPEGPLHVFPGHFRGDPESVTFRLAKLDKFINEGVYRGWIEVLIDNRQFVPAEFNLKFKKAMNVQVESIQHVPLQKAPTVSASPVMVVQKPAAEKSAVAAAPKRVSLREWYKDAEQGQKSSK